MMNGRRRPRRAVERSLRAPAMGITTSATNAPTEKTVANARPFSASEANLSTSAGMATASRAPQ